MPADPVITYQFSLPDGAGWSFSVHLNRAQLPQPVDSEPKPEWTRLAFNRCSNCTLADSCTFCPAAVDAHPLLEKFAGVLSTTRVKVTVHGQDRCVIADTDAQMGLKALLGLIMATSACPVLAPLRSQAVFHLPFASLDETLYRTVGDYLIKQYFVARDGGKPDFGLEGLDALYRELATLNSCFFKRIQEACTKDASLNAVVVLKSMSDIVSMSLEDRLSPLREAMQGGA